MSKISRALRGRVRVAVRTEEGFREREQVLARVDDLVLLYYSGFLSHRPRCAVALEAMLAPGNDLNRFDENRGASIQGIVVRVLPGGVESVNCHAQDFAHRDTHIELALSPTAVPTDRVIVEITPLWRQLMAARGIDWSTPSLNVNLVGRKVEVTGWLMFDREHVTGSRNTSPGNPQNWRATAWEVHPITEIRVLP